MPEKLDLAPDSMRALFYPSFQRFLALEWKGILQSRVHERSLCFRLGLYLEDERRAAGLDGYYVDAEYNRQQNGQIKMIVDGQEQEIRITCDLILHSRGENKWSDNLIAIEMKKSGREQEEKDADRIRLGALTKASYDNVWSADGVTDPEYVCGYQLGLFIEVNDRTGQIMVEEFENGQIVRCQGFQLDMP